MSSDNNNNDMDNNMNINNSENIAETNAISTTEPEISISVADIHTYFFVTTGYCSGFIPCRSFAEKGSAKEDSRPVNEWIVADDNAADKALEFAKLAAKNGMAFYIIPGTVGQIGQARSADIMEMQSLLIDIDSGNTEKKLAILAENIGTPTLIVESGGITGEGHKKLHIYWQLSKAVSGEDLQKLLELRHELAKAVDGDTHFKSAHQPIRVAGSFYYKGGARKPVVIREFIPLEYSLEELITGVKRLADNSKLFAGSLSNTNEALNFNNTALKSTTIEEILTQKVYEGGEGEDSRYGCISRVTGYWLFLHHRGIINMEQAVEAIKGYNLSCMVPPWPEEKLNRTIKGLWELHVQKYGVPKSQGQEEEDEELLELINPRIYKGVTIPEREWIIEDWIPRGCVTALYGDGGVGKTLLVQQLMTCLATGKAFLGKKSAPVKVCAVMCEDDLNELMRRQNKINALYEADLDDLDNVRFASRVSKDNLLMTFSYGSIGRLTKFFEKLYQTVLEYKPDLIILDTVADFFGGNENVRLEVKQFIQTACGRIANDMNTAILLCAHPSESGMMKGTGTGGSTAWNNSVRVRLYLTVPKGDKFNENHRVLTRVKSNYSTITGAQVYYELNNGVLRELSEEEISQPTAFSKKQNKTNHKLQTILNLIDCEAATGKIHTANSFGVRFADKKTGGCGLGTRRTICNMIAQGVKQELIKFFCDPTIYGLPLSYGYNSYGYICTENTMLKVGEDIDSETGRSTARLVRIVPTHCRSDSDKRLIPIKPKASKIDEVAV